MHTEQDLQAIRQVVADAETLQNDLDGFTGLLTEDVVIVNVAGRRVRGRDQLYAAMKAALATPLVDVLTKNEIEAIHFLRSDVAVAMCVKHVSDQRAEASTAVPDKGALTFVLVKEEGSWLIASAQTTPILS
ncbi:MAG: SgcJ/EcaC family oxidoreductase [Acidimicrobiales bacterium]